MLYKAFWERGKTSPESSQLQWIIEHIFNPLVWNFKSLIVVHFMTFSGDMDMDFFFFFFPSSSHSADIWIVRHKVRSMSITVTCKERKMGETHVGREEEETKSSMSAERLWMSTVCVYSCLLKGARAFLQSASVYKLDLSGIRYRLPFS